MPGSVLSALGLWPAHSPMKTPGSKDSEQRRWFARSRAGLACAASLAQHCSKCAPAQSESLSDMHLLGASEVCPALQLSTLWGLPHRRTWSSWELGRGPGQTLISDSSSSPLSVLLDTPFLGGFILFEDHTISAQGFLLTLCLWSSSVMGELTYGVPLVESTHVGAE